MMSKQRLARALGCTAIVVFALGCSDDSEPMKDGPLPADGAPADGAPADGGADATIAKYPQLGLYIVNADGSNLRLLKDAGEQALTHVRRQRGSDWMTATRYTLDLDGNGFSMELEGGAANYVGAEVVLFRQSDLDTITVVAGDEEGMDEQQRLCANSSFTDDGKLIFIQQDPSPGTNTPGPIHLKRATFAALPEVNAVEELTLPSELLVPVDPHQRGASDGSGTIVFSAYFNHAAGWMRPVWRMDAAGATTMADVSLVGCPICPEQAGGGCCGFPAGPDPKNPFVNVLGTNDARISHDGQTVRWMQQHPDISFANGASQAHPYRQVQRVGQAPQVDQIPGGIAATTTQSFGEWREDDQEVVYWQLSADLTAGVVRSTLHLMKSDGRERRQVPLPQELCVSHPSYLSATELVFSAFRCAGAHCTCLASEI